MKSLLKNKWKLAMITIFILIPVFAICLISRDIKPTYIPFLKKNESYIGELKKPEVIFEYSSPADSNLADLRERYNLDSIAGNGSETEKIINLMEWVHSISNHANNPAWPKTMNAHNLIDLCLTEKKSINCFMYSTILNEVYLSMGYYSRFVHLWYTRTGESHVVTAVYSESLGKWIMMDADFGTFLTDENGNILGIPEIRHRIINKEKMHVSDNMEVAGSGITKFLGKIFGVDNIYSWYLSKNIFRYSTPLRSVYDIQSDRTADIIYLIPTNYISKVNPYPKHRETERYDLYYTDDEEFFWQKPVSLN